MAPIADRAAIRAILSADPVWCVYALGDLEPHLFERTSWFRSPAGPPALAALYRGGGPPVLFTFGAPEGIAAVMDEIAGEPELLLQIRPEDAGAVASRYEILKAKPMWRMALDRSRYRPVAAAGAERLALSDLDALNRLYDDGRPSGEAPGYFLPWMLEEFLFLGVREGGELAAAAGTHLISVAEGVAAIGNVYTRRDRRGRGFAAMLAGALAGELLAMGIRVIALSVEQANAGAIRIYERLGFVKRCEFIEGRARRKSCAASTLARAPAPEPE